MQQKILLATACALSATLSASAQNAFFFNSNSANTRQDIGVSSGIVTFAKFQPSNSFPSNLSWDSIKVGIGLNNPTHTLHVVGKFKYQDGTEANGAVLTSDANGVASWAGLSSLRDHDWYRAGSSTNNEIDYVHQDKYTQGRNGFNMMNPLTSIHFAGVARADGSLSSANLSNTDFNTNGPNSGFQMLETSAEPVGTTTGGGYGGMILERTAAYATDMHLYFGLNDNTTAHNMIFSHVAWNSAASKHQFTEMARLTNGGYWGLGDNAPTYRLQLPNNNTGNEGRAIAVSWNTYSDARIKTDVKKIPYGLETIMQLAPKSYVQHNSNNQDGRLKIEPTGTKSIGFLAQDLQKVIPEIVTVPKDESKQLWSVDYTRIIPVMVQAIQDQQAIIDAQKSELTQLNNRLAAIEKILAGSESNQPKTTHAADAKRDENTLFQNTPNPFTEQTTIRYELKQGGKVSLAIYSEAGNTIAELVNERQEAGTYTAVWNAADAMPGTYMYVLRQDGKILMKKAIKL